MNFPYEDEHRCFVTNQIDMLNKPFFHAAGNKPVVQSTNLNDDDDGALENILFVFFWPQITRIFK